MKEGRVVGNWISGAEFRNCKERYSLRGEQVINIRCRYGRYDPEIQKKVSARLAVGKVRWIKQEKEKVGTLLRLKPDDLTTLTQAIGDSGFLQDEERFYLNSAGLNGWVENPACADGSPLLEKGTPLDRAFQEFFSDGERRLWDLCLIYFRTMQERRQEIYRFFISC